MDGLRGWASAAVVFFHAIIGMDPNLTSGPYSHTIFSSTSLYWSWSKVILSIFNGESAVIIFFVLSGCVLHASVLRAISEEKTIGSGILDFSIKRIFRIYPAMIFCVLVIGVIFKISSHYFPSLFTSFTKLDFIENFLLLKPTIQPATWTLTVEVFATIPIIIIGLLEKYYGPAIASAIFLMVAALLCFTSSYLLIDLSTFSIWVVVFQISYFAYGYVIPTRLGLIISKYSNVYLALIAFLSVHMFIPVKSFYSTFLQAVFAFTFISCLYHGENGLLARFLRKPLSQYLGKLSFSIYLWNILFLDIFWRFFPSFLRIPPYSEFPIETGFIVGLLILLLTIPVSHLSVRFIERPFIQFGRYLIMALRLSRAA